MACPGQPFDPSPGLRVSIGDPDAAPGTDAYKGVIVLQGGDPDPIPKAANPIDVKVYFKTALGAAYILPEDMSVTVHVRDLAGDPGGLSPFTGGALVHPDVPAGATVGAAGDIVNWFSSSVTIDAATLADDTTYRITVDADDVDTGVFFFCDLTIIHTEAV